MAKRKSIEDRFELYDSVEECADKAAPIFQQKRWKWTRCGIPNRSQIFAELIILQVDYGKMEGATPYVASGRLIFYLGRFGHEKVIADKAE